MAIIYLSDAEPGKNHIKMINVHCTGQRYRCRNDYVMHRAAFKKGTPENMHCNFCTNAIKTEKTELKNGAKNDPVFSIDRWLKDRWR